MLKKLLNQATLELTIQAQGPLLIKSGIEGGADPSVPDMQFVRTRGQVYIPGSSLKGVFRSYAEKIARTVNPEAKRDWCCDPLDDNPNSPTCSCSRRTMDKERLARQEGRSLTSAEKYRRRDCTCRICQLFGSTALASRIKFNDAYATDGYDPMTETRTSVAIDRILGAALRGGLFDFEVVTATSFQTSIHLRNFELWQLGLLALVLRDLEEGLIPIGFGKSRGLGDVDAKVQSFSVRYMSLAPDTRTNTTNALYGIGYLATDEDRKAYWSPTENPDRDTVSLEAEGSLRYESLGVCVTFNEAVRPEVFRKCVNERWREVLRHDRRG